ncbi:MAG: oligoendopeptidase F [Myxococcota bacterium]
MFVLLAALALAAADQTVRPEDTWDLAPLYPSVEAWEAEMTRLQTAVGTPRACYGELDTRLRACLDLRWGLQKDLARASTYANAASSADTRDDAWRERAQRASLLFTRFSEAVSFYEPEIVALGEKRVTKALAKDPKLAPYGYYLKSTLRDAAHTLDPEREAMLAATGDLRDAPGRLRDVLVNAELPWPTVQIRGEDVRLDAAAYTLHRADPDREVRKRVFDTFFGAFTTYEGTLGTALDTAVRGHWFVAKARGYDSSVAAAIDVDHLPRAVYDQLVARTQANLPTLHRYLKLRAKMLGVSDLAYHDLYTPLVASDRTWTIEEAKQLSIASAAPLGPTYAEILTQGFGARWMDVYPRPGKDSGAWMDGAAYDVHPFVLMNYNGDYESVTTLAHEWGHAAHSAYAMKAQPYPTADYATFTAEIASTFAEALLVDHLLKNAKTDDERLFYLGSALESLRTTYFRQAQLAEFELAVHTQVEKGEALTGDGLSATYLDILKRYYGHDQGVTHISDRDAVEWAYIPHFYYNFYVYQYATSIAAASLLSEDVLAGKPGAVDRYLALLKAGGSDDPAVLLKNAGVDMTSPAPYDAIARRMERLMDEIEAILAKKR